MDKMKFELNDVVLFEYKGKQYVGTILIRDFELTLIEKNKD